jgi:hypothetical protein
LDALRSNQRLLDVDASITIFSIIPCRMESSPSRAATRLPMLGCATHPQPSMVGTVSTVSKGLAPGHTHPLPSSAASVPPEPWRGVLRIQRHTLLGPVEPAARPTSAGCPGA